jgi:hypothetical protein
VADPGGGGGGGACLLYRMPLHSLSLGKTGLARCCCCCCCWPCQQSHDILLSGGADGYVIKWDVSKGDLGPPLQRLPLLRPDQVGEGVRGWREGRRGGLM